MAELDLSQLDNKSTLYRLGIEEGTRYETIVTTNGPHFNAAAIGVRRFGEKFNLKIFELSNTYDNIIKQKEENGSSRIGINIVDISRLELLCYAALRGWGSPIAEFPAESFELVRETPVLKDAPLCIACEIEELRTEDVKDVYGTTRRLDVTAGIVEIVARTVNTITPIKRGAAEPLLDALVLATRFKIARGNVKDKCRTKVEELLKRSGEPQDNGHALTRDALKEFFGITD